MISQKSKGVMAILLFNLEKEARSVMALPKEAMPISWHVEFREIQGLVSLLRPGQGH